MQNKEPEKNVDVQWSVRCAQYLVVSVVLITYHRRHNFLVPVPSSLCLDVSQMQSRCQGRDACVARDLPEQTSRHEYYANV